jgi:hypothetical protein
MMGSVAAGVREFGDSPTAAMTALDDLETQGFDPKRLTPLRMQIVEHPEAIGQLVDGLLKQSPDEAHRAMVKKAPEAAKSIEVQPGNQIVDSATGKVIYSAPAKPEPAAKPAPFTLGPGQTRYSDSGQAIASRPDKPSESAADVTAVTPAAVELAALNYRKTGIMPPLGMGDKHTRQHPQPGRDVDAGRHHADRSWRDGRRRQQGDVQG